MARTQVSKRSALRLQGRLRIAAVGDGYSILDAIGTFHGQLFTAAPTYENEELLAILEASLELFAWGEELVVRLKAEAQQNTMSPELANCMEQFAQTIDGVHRRLRSSLR